MPQVKRLPPGMIRGGNIDLNNRPVVQNPNGDISTELSFSRGTNQGEVLVPQVVGGQILPQDQAWQHYQQTGENMGLFADPAIADEYARQVHDRPIAANRSQRPMYVMPVNSSKKPRNDVFFGME